MPILQEQKSVTTQSRKKAINRGALKTHFGEERFTTQGLFHSFTTTTIKL